jgi:hypothetical protein
MPASLTRFELRPCSQPAISPNRIAPSRFSVVS